jgi:hypothetical protein
MVLDLKTNFKNNFTKIGLLSNRPIKFWNDEEEFYLTLPTVYDVYTNFDLMHFINFLDTDIGELKKGFVGIEITSHYELIKILLVLSKRQDDLKDLSKSFISAFKIILPDFFLDDFLNVNKNIRLTKSLFDEIIFILYESLDKKKITINEDDDEFTRIEKEAMLRAQRIREKSRELKGDSDNRTKLEDIIAAIIYEYPQYKLEDVFELNIYTLNYLFKYIGKIANYEVSKIAAGNGLSKKHKYFIEK